MSAMLEGILPQEQARHRLMADITGTAAGLLAFLLWRGFMSPSFSQWGALQLAGLSLATSACAGLAAAFLVLALIRVPDSDALRVAMRASFRAGIISVLVASGVILVAMVNQAFAAPTHSADAQARMLAWHSFFALAAAIISSVPAGIAGGFGGFIFCRPHLATLMLAPMLRLKPRVAADQAEHDHAWQRWITRGIVLLAILGMLSPLRLLVTSPKVDPPPIIEASPPEITIVAPRPAPFRYTKPPVFDSAETNQIVVKTRQNLPSIQATKPIIISPDSRLVAFCPAGVADTGVMVMELDTLNSVASFSLTTAPDHLAWSPDNNKLFYITKGEQTRMGVLNVDNSSVFLLPRPKNRDLPVGMCLWWQEGEVICYPDDEAPLCLNLDTLLLRPLDQSVKYKALDASLKKPWIAPPRISLPVAKSWRMEFIPLLQTIMEPPRKSPHDQWSFKGLATLGFIDSIKPIRSPLSALSLQSNDRVVPAPDGSKVILLRSNGQCEIVYFTLRNEALPFVRAQMPMGRDKAPSFDVKPGSFDATVLCAFAYAPMLNPLTGKTIGPDREHLRAVLRLVKWEGASADWWPAVQYAVLREGDVIADLHTWKNGQITPSKSLANTEWWNETKLVLDADRGSIPSLAKAGELDMRFTAQIGAEPYAVRFDSLSQSTRPNESPKQQPISESDIMAFIRQHHAKASARDIDGLLADYDEVIENPVKGNMITRGQLRAREEADIKKWPKGNEVVQSVTSVRNAGSSWDAEYVMQFSNNGQHGETHQGLVDITMSLRAGSDGLKIQKQLASVREAPPTKAAPPVSASLKGSPTSSKPAPVPCWIGTAKINGPSGNIEVTDTIRINNSAGEILRSFHSFGSKGQILKSCRHEIRGKVTRQGNTITFQIREQAWVRDGDADFMNDLKSTMAMAEGANLIIMASGDNLVINGVEVLKPQK